ncbi:Do family serine endopeptidase [Jannaschia donghaensis]|uniref:Probable periplasmic serine endoprotease DegP-like n=1 Tax=Jannaschia donghaensis TaxID=420998 RepID=A0A0M6YGQ5_9RHOB|nr:Do family serine endopeptidase [Jannaschia donghaensis]CTQ48447.1 putative periplasmic serine endoprotease DegP-like precursor [Jannaschia donghaensis]
MDTNLQRPVIAPLRALTALILGVAFLIASALTAAAQSRPDTFADLVDQVSGAVVNITTNTTVTAGARGPNSGNPLDDFFEEFRRRGQPEGEIPQPPSRRGSALGSGFVISEDGYIVTNNHVIENADEILIEFFSGQELPAELIGTDPNTDIALLKVEYGTPLPFVPFGDSDAMRTGDWVMAMGNPLGQGFSVSAGIVSSVGRELSGAYDDYIQTDAAINRGNSGGPLFNLDGQVIGVNTAILSPTGGSIGIGFAMSSNVVTNVVDQLQEFGETRRGWLGVRIQDVDEELAEALGLERARGALVTDVPDGPAKDAGVEARDVILTFDGTDVADTKELVRTVGNAPVDKAVRVVIFRDGETQTLLVTLGRREDAEAPIPASASPEEPAESTIMGLTVSSLTEELRGQLDLDADAKGLVVTDVEDDSAAFEKGLRAGDVIEEAGQVAVTTVADLEERIETAQEAGQKSFLLLVRRGEDARFVALPLAEG